MSAGIDLSTYFAGAFGGICALMVVLSVLVGQAYSERMLWWHATTVIAGLMVEFWSDRNPMLATTLWTLQLAVAALTLRATVGGTGAARRPAIALSLLSPAFGLAALLGLARAPSCAWLLLPWSAAVVWCLFRVWAQSKPWVYWIALGQLALGMHALVVLEVLPDFLLPAPQIQSMAALAVFAIATYLALVWFSRLRAENGLRVEARERIDPLTGLATPTVFFDRADGALVRSRNLRYRCAFVVVRIGNIDRIVEEENLENSESVILAASRAIGSTLRAQDSAARLGNNRFAVMAEGVREGAEGALATRIVAHGLRASDFGIIGSALHFQVAIVEIARPDLPARAILRQLDEALTQLAEQGSAHHIRVLPRMG